MQKRFGDWLINVSDYTANMSDAFDWLPFLWPIYVPIGWLSKLTIRLAWLVTNERDVDGSQLAISWGLFEQLIVLVVAGLFFYPGAWVKSILTPGSLSQVWLLPAVVFAFGLLIKASRSHGRLLVRGVTWSEVLYVLTPIFALLAGTIFG